MCTDGSVSRGTAAGNSRKREFNLEPDLHRMSAPNRQILICHTLCTGSKAAGVLLLGRS